ncbi:MAG: hypothetical protein ACI4CY_01115, partial [Candidatus Gastranaerophilaceae bacterium]
LKTDAAENASKTSGAGEVPKTDNAVELQQKKIVSVSEKQKLPELETSTFKPDKPLDGAEFLKTASADKKLLIDVESSCLNKKYNIVDEQSIEDIKTAVLVSFAMRAWLQQSGVVPDNKDINLLLEAVLSVSEKQKLPELETSTFKPDKPFYYAEFLKTASADKKWFLDVQSSFLNKKYNIVDEKSIEDIKPAALASWTMMALLQQSGFLSDIEDIKLLAEAEFLDNCGAELTEGKREDLNQPVTELLNGISNETIDNCQNLSVESKSYLKERFDALKENFAYFDLDGLFGDDVDAELQKPAEA